MAYPLTTPGVDISVTDESFYATSGDGTVPLFIFGTHEYKNHPNGTDVAAGTLPENANKLYLITSQRELVQNFGNPVFYQKNGTSRHGYEINEYGLWAAYSYLGIANKAFVIRGSIDYSQLFPRQVEPKGEPFAGTYWLDTTSTAWGIHQGVDSTRPGSAWVPQSPIVIDENVEVEYRVIGTAGQPSPTAQVITSGGNLEINGQVVVLAGGDDLQSVVTKINAASITGVVASVFQLAGMSHLLIRDTTEGGMIDLTGTSAGVSAELGLDNVVGSYGPLSNIGVEGSFAVVLTENNDNEFFQKLRADGVATANDPLAMAFWFRVGSKEWKAANVTRITGSNLGTSAIPALAAQTLTINVTNNVADAVDVSFVGATNTVSDVAAAINTALAADTGPTGEQVEAFAQNGSLVLVNKIGGDIVLDSDSAAAIALGIETKFGVALRFSPHFSIPSRIDDINRKRVVAGDVWVNTTQFNNGAQWVVKYFNGNTGLWDTITAPLLVDDIAANALYGANKSVGVLYVQYNVTGTAQVPTATHMIKRWNGLTWEPLTYNYGPNAPTTDAEEGTLWFNDNFRVDIMINDGDQWVGYRNYPGNLSTSSNGPIISASTPMFQQNGLPLQNNDIWINSGDLEEFPKIYRYQASTRSWFLVDNTDSTTPFGIVFADARATANGRRNGPTDSASMLTSNFLDPDAPDPRVYPEGTLLFNTRYSTYNVKEWRPNYFSGEYQSTDFTMEDYNVGFTTFDPLVDGGRWVTISGNKEDGSPNMGRKAQRAVIVRALQSTISGNQDIRAESIYFNLIAAPGYPELIDEMVTLNTDKKEVAFVVGDTPIRLGASSTELQTYANIELSGVAGNSEDGIATFNPYVGVYYPWGLSTNIDGYEIMVPPSAMAIRSIAYSDSISYPWYAPAGFTRGMVTNAINVGYLTAEDEFRPVLLNEAQRSVLYTNNINPIAYMPQRGLVIMGQKTRNPTASALDRINVARLINHMRYNLDNLSQPFLFQPHTFHTRDSIRIAFERYLASLVNLDAMYDFIVVCDETNNTPDRIDRNELWVDIAIQPVKAIEFIYIPIRIVNTGDDLSELYATQTTL